MRYLRIIEPRGGLISRHATEREVRVSEAHEKRCLGVFREREGGRKGYG